MIHDIVIPFRKMNGLGNEIVVIDARDRQITIASDQAAMLGANPRTHFDQLMVLYPADPVEIDATVQIFNTDGSGAEACGNGMRCVGLTVFEQTRSGFSISIRENCSTMAGIRECETDTPPLRCRDFGRAAGTFKISPAMHLGSLVVGVP